MSQIQITQSIAIEESEIQYHFIRSSGPGGQNVNKLSTAVQLQFNISSSPSLSLEVRERLIKLAGKKVSLEGVLRITAQKFRKQRQNKQDAFDRLCILIRKAAVKPSFRRPTKPSAASKKNRLEKKRRRGEIKTQRSNTTME